MGFPVGPLSTPALFGSGWIGDVTLDGVVSSVAVTDLPGNAALAISKSTGSFQNGCTTAYALNGDAYFHNLTINSGCVLCMEGDRLFVSGTLTLQAGAGIDWGPSTSQAATSATGATGVGASTDPVAGSGPGGTGTATTGGNGAVPTTPTPFGTGTGVVKYLGGKGGLGGAAANAAGTTPNVPNVTEPFGLPYGIDSAVFGMAISNDQVTQWLGGSGGSAGGGDGVNSGGGGGAGAGVVIVVARFIQGSGFIQSSGGAGFTPTVGNCGGGGGGAGGGIIIVSTSVQGVGHANWIIPGITVASLGGAGGAGVGTGNPGAIGGVGKVIMVQA